MKNIVKLCVIFFGVSLASCSCPLFDSFKDVTPEKKDEKTSVLALNSEFNQDTLCLLCLANGPSAPKARDTPKGMNGPAQPK